MADFIPKPYKKEPVTIRADSDVLERLDQIAAESDLSRSALIGQCIDYALGTLGEERPPVKDLKNAEIPLKNTVR